MPALPRLLLSVAAIAAAAAAVHRIRHQARPTAAGVLIADVPLYDRLTGLLLGPFYAGVARDVAVTIATGGTVLDVGCGPGHLVERLVDRGLTVSGIDLDPAMIARGEARLGDRAALATADVAALPFGDTTFDAVVSTLSMHHWSDPARGLAEVGRVLRPGGVALIYDLRGAHMPLHGHVREPRHLVEDTPLELVSDTPWRWPGRFALVHRVMARRATGPAAA